MPGTGRDRRETLRALTGSSDGELTFHSSENLERLQLLDETGPTGGGLLQVRLTASGIQEEWEVTNIFSRNLVKGRPESAPGGVRLATGGRQEGGVIREEYPGARRKRTPAKIYRRYSGRNRPVSGRNARSRRNRTGNPRPPQGGTSTNTATWPTSNTAGYDKNRPPDRTLDFVQAGTNLRKRQGFEIAGPRAEPP